MPLRCADPLNADPDIYNEADPVSGMASMPRNMTGMAMKMAAAGYQTHMFGKWDVGMATPDHTPHGRGYMTAMHYFHHANDYYTSVTGDCRGTGVVDLWQTNIDRPNFQGPAHMYNNTCTNGPQCPLHSDSSCVEGLCSARGSRGDHVYGGCKPPILLRRPRLIVKP